MARRLRVEYVGAIYHVMSRGDHQEAVFADDADRECFLETLGEACAKTDWQVHAYCLMGNHFHLVMETPRANLTAGMKWLLGTYTGRFNRRHRKCGHLFAGRYKALVVEGSGSGYLRTVCEYVHLNPVRARLLSPEDTLRAYRWSSYLDYLRPPTKRPAWLRVDRVLGEVGIPKDSPAGRARFERLMEERRRAKEPVTYRQIRRGWCWGERAFRQELLAQMSQRLGPNHYGPERGETEEEQAEAVLARELARQRVRDTELMKLPKNHRAKLRAAQVLRAETTRTVGWIAERLAMGSRQYVTKLLYLSRKNTPKASI